MCLPAGSHPLRRDVSEAKEQCYFSVFRISPTEQAALVIIPVMGEFPFFIEKAPPVCSLRLAFVLACFSFSPSAPMVWAVQLLALGVTVFFSMHGISPLDASSETQQVMAIENLQMIPDVPRGAESPLS